jgi:hypothetical protein
MEGTSLIKIQTQRGPKANSNNIKKVSSPANKYLVEYRNSIFGISDTKHPRSMHLNISIQVKVNVFLSSKRQNKDIKIPEIAKAGNISMLRCFRTITAYTENDMAVKNAISAP